MTVNYNTDLPQFTGLERVQHFAAQADERFGIAKVLGYSVENIASGEVVLSYRPVDEHVNLLATIHGGVLASLLDTAMGCAVMTTLGVGEQHTMIDLHTKFLRPVTPDTGLLKIVGTVEHRGRRQCTMRGKVLAPEDKPCATATATAMIL